MNCKSGDLAITLFSHIEGNTGRIVRVIEATKRRNGMDYWRIESVGGPMGVAAGGVKMTGQFPDKYLKPVSGLSEPESITTGQENEVAA